MANFGMDVSYIYRKDDHELWDHRIGETRDMWVHREWPNASTTAAQIAAIPAGLPTSGWIYYEIAPGVSVPQRGPHAAQPAILLILGLGDRGPQAHEQPLDDERVVHLERSPDL